MRSLLPVRPIGALLGCPPSYLPGLPRQAMREEAQRTRGGRTCRVRELVKLRPHLTVRCLMGLTGLSESGVRGALGRVGLKPNSGPSGRVPSLPPERDAQLWVRHAEGTSFKALARAEGLGYSVARKAVLRHARVNGLEVRHGG